MLRCPECRSRRATFTSMTAHIKASGHKFCDCSGYHFRHRPGSPYCESNPMCTYNRADRAGASEKDLAELLARATICPF